MGVSIYFLITYQLLLLDFGQTKPIQEEEPEDHLGRPEVEYNEEGIEEVTFSYNDHNNDNDHVTFGNMDHLDLHLDDQLTSKNDLFYDNESNNEPITSRMLNVLSRGLLKTIRRPEPDLDYEIEDRIVRYAMNNKREEI